MGFLWKTPLFFSSGRKLTDEPVQMSLGAQSTVGVLWSWAGPGDH